MSQRYLKKNQVHTMSGSKGVSSKVESNSEKKPSENFDKKNGKTFGKIDEEKNLMTENKNKRREKMRLKTKD